MGSSHCPEDENVSVSVYKSNFALRLPSKAHHFGLLDRGAMDLESAKPQSPPVSRNTGEMKYGDPQMPSGPVPILVVNLNGTKLNVGQVLSKQLR